MNINIPGGVQHIISTLENSGYEAYAVGGCVRDSLLGKQPEDWDICTSALPEQTIACFAGHQLIETGLQHGTVTLMLDGKPYEITTYRAEGKYKDSRRPESVKFVSVLKRDLARRDFTINAMAYNANSGLVDYYGGAEDLSNGVIKCVGNAGKRLREDALRIMRALRFAAAFDFLIEAETWQAMDANKKLLHNIAAERVAAELNKLIVSGGASNALSRYGVILLELIPELAGAAGTLGIGAAPEELTVRLALLFTGAGASEDTARAVLTRLKYDSGTVNTVAELALWHDADIQACAKSVKRWLNKIGEARFRQLIELKKAVQGRADGLNEILALTDEIIEQGQAFSLKHLAVTGRDLRDAGIPEGKQIGEILGRLMDMVIDGQAANDKAALLEIVRDICKEDIGVIKSR